MTSHRSWYCVALAFVLAGAVGYRSSILRRTEVRPFGRFTSDQIVARAETLVKSIDPAAPPFRLSSVHSPADASIHTWDVVCKALDGKDIAHITWNADTGELVSLGHLRKPGALPEGPTLDRKEAVNSAWQWLKVVGVSKLSRTWHVDQAKHSGEDIWFVKLRSEDRSAFVTLGSKNRDLRWLMTWRSPPATEKIRPCVAAPVQAAAVIEHEAPYLQLLAGDPIHHGRQRNTVS